MKPIALIKKYARYAVYYTAILIVITAAYVIANGLFNFSPQAQNAILLITSPFNSGHEQHYIGNIGFAFVELVLIEVYFSLKRRRDLLKLIFVATILGSYITSVYVLFLSKISNGSASVSAGSSIVAAGLMVIAFIALVCDFLVSLRGLFVNLRSRELAAVPVLNLKTSMFGAYYARVVVYFVLAVAALLYTYGAFLNPGYVETIIELHLTGVVLSGILLLAFYIFGRDRSGRRREGSAPDKLVRKCKLRSRAEH